MLTLEELHELERAFPTLTWNERDSIFQQARQAITLQAEIKQLREANERGSAEHVWEFSSPDHVYCLQCGLYQTPANIFGMCFQTTEQEGQG